MTSKKASYKKTTTYEGEKTRFFEYPSYTDSSSFSPAKHDFWTAFHAKGGAEFFDFVAQVTDLAKEIDEEDAQAALEDALPIFRYAVSVLPRDKPLPLAIASFLSGVRELIEHAPRCDDDWHKFPFSIRRYPALPENVALPSGKAPADKKIRDAPALSVQFPKVKRPRSDSPELEVIKPPRPKASYASKGKEKVEDVARAPSKKKAKAEPVEEDEEEGEEEVEEKPRRTRNTRVNYADPNSDDERGSTPTATKRKTVPATTKAARKEREIEAKVEAMLPTIKEALFKILSSNTTHWTSFAFDNPVGTFGTLAIGTKQGGRIPKPLSHFGNENRTRQGEEDALAAIPLLDLEPVKELQIGNTVAPGKPCLPCLIFRSECHAVGVGHACVRCNVKKLHAFCDHSLNTQQIRQLVVHIQSYQEGIFPLGDTLSLETLTHKSELFVSSKELSNALLVDLASEYRSVFERLAFLMHTGGDTGFEAVFASAVGKGIADRPALETVNSLIVDFNKALDESYQPPSSSVLGSNQPASGSGRNTVIEVESEDDDKRGGSQSPETAGDESDEVRRPKKEV